MSATNTAAGSTWGAMRANTRRGGMVTILGTTAVALGFFGVLGSGVAWGVDLAKNNIIAQRQKKLLVDEYREQIASRLNKDPRSVNVSDLELVAKSDPAFGALMNSVQREKARADRSSTMVAGAVGAAGLATGGAMWLPGASAVAAGTATLAQSAAHGAATLGVHGAVGVGAGLTSNVFNKDVIETLDMAEHIDAKIQQGMPIEAMDVMLLRIAQDESLQQQIKKMPGANNTPLHKMNDVQQRAVLAAMPELYDLAERDAQAVNARRITPQDLLVSSPGQAQQVFGQHTARIQSRARSGSWTQQVNTSRAPTPAGGMVRS